MVLIRCETFYDLINAINIKLTLLKDVSADLVLTRSSNFTNVFSKVEALNIFSKIYLSEDSWLNGLEIKKLAATQKRQITLHPEKYLISEEWQNKEYEEFYIPTFTSEYHCLVYYNFYYKFKKVPKVVMYEDGTDSYSRNNATVIKDRCSACLDASVFPSKIRFENNVKAIMVYEPEICQNASNYTIIPIPKISEEIFEILTRIFDREFLPKEKCIYLSEPFHDEFINNNEIQLLDRIAEKIGKENIIVKMHPRCSYDQFSPRGYKVLENSNIPWEIIAADKSIENKLLIAVSSTTLFSPKLIYNYNLKSIMLTKLVIKNRFFARMRGFQTLINSIYEHFNSDTRNLFIPRHQQELDMALDYYEMMLEENNE